MDRKTTVGENLKAKETAFTTPNAVGQNHSSGVGESNNIITPTGTAPPETQVTTSGTKNSVAPTPFPNNHTPHDMANSSGVGHTQT